MRRIILDVLGSKDVFLVKRKRSKRISLSMEKKGFLKVSIPYYLSYKEAEILLNNNMAWVEKYILRMEKVEADHKALPKEEKKYSKNEATRIIRKRVCEISEKLGLEYSGIKVKEIKTRWGSCTAKNYINLNLKLINLPGYLMDYVIVHELIHTKIKNHKKEFWEEIEKCLPGGRDLDRALKKYYPQFL